MTRGDWSMRLARAALHRVPPLRRLARHLHERFTAERAFEVDPPELTPIAARADQAGPVRLNLLLPGASSRHVFGGAATALALFDALHRGEPRRLLVTDERELEAIDPVRFAGWEVARLDGPHPTDRPLLVPMADRAGRSLPVHANDRFVATAWWTAHHARALAHWQGRTFGIEPPAFIYLIQDYEPGFYPWSTRFALADQTYAFTREAIGVYNTAGLRAYVRARHAALAREFVFEPSLNPALAAELPAGQGVVRQRRILIYGRPSVPRNAFGLIVQGLRAWATQDPAAASWAVVSLGEAHPPLELGRPPGAAAPLVLHSEGKVGLTRYAQLMRESAIGIGLMLSPHPSYPPLEMAAFGMRVLTNRFEAKHLSADHPNIEDLPEVSPSAIAQALTRWVARFDPDRPEAWSAPPGGFARSRPGFPFADELRAAWLGARD